MAGLKVVSGLPGSGKTYYLVDLIVRDYFEFDPKYFEYKNPKNVTIVTNIKGLKLPHKTLDSVWQNAGCSSLDQFLAIPLLPGHTEEQSVEASIVYKWCMKHAPVVFLVDEAQRRWPYTHKNNDVGFFFQYHRHLGVDIYLSTQNWKDLWPKITGLCEFEIRATPSSKRLLNELKYKTFCEYEQIGSFSLPYSKRIAALYTSFDASEHGRTVRPLRKYLLYAVIMVFILLGALFFAYRYLTSKHIEKDMPVITETSKRKRESVASRPVVDSSSGSKVASPVASLRGKLMDDSLAGLVDRGTVEQEFVRVDCGAAWVDGKIIAVEFFGQMIPISRFPFQVLPDPVRYRAEVVVPSSALAQVRQAVWLDSRGVINGSVVNETLETKVGGADETSDVGTVDMPNGRYYSRR